MHVKGLHAGINGGIGLGGTIRRGAAGRLARPSRFWFGACEYSLAGSLACIRPGPGGRRATHGILELHSDRYWRLQVTELQVRTLGVVNKVSVKGRLCDLRLGRRVAGPLEYLLVLSIASDSDTFLCH